MSNNRVSKAERLLNRLQREPSCSLTPEGANYVKQRFDPYHDNPIKPGGYPDAYNGFTVSRCVKKSMTLSQTSGGLPATETPWDMHIFNTQCLDPDFFTLVTDASSGGASQFEANFNNSTPKWGGVMIQGNNASGTQFNYLDPSSATESILGQISLSENDLSDNMRVIAMGIEIIDGTAALYRQGILTAYRQNQPQQQQFTFQGFQTPNAANTIATYTGSGRLFKLPPTDTKSALLIPDSKQWKVEEGAYISVDFNSEDIPMIAPETVVACYQDDFEGSEISSTVTQFRALHKPNNYVDRSILTTTPTTWRSYGGATHRYLPVNTNGIFLTGLNPLATITVNVIYYLECAPDGDDEELLTLASESPALDVFAMMMVSELRRDAPVAVKLYENYMGEWFVDGVKSIISKVLPWMHNAGVVGRQINSWADEASANDGMLNPQSFVRGPVSEKVAKEKKIKKGVIPPPPVNPAPKKIAFRPKPVTEIVSRGQGHWTSSGYGKKKNRRVRGFDDTEAHREDLDRMIRRGNATGKYKALPPPKIRRSPAKLQGRQRR